MIPLRADSSKVIAAGFKGCKIADPKQTLQQLRSKWPALQLQLVKADRIAGTEHIWFAARNAIQAFDSKYRRSRSLAVEFLIYLSCTRQINKGIERLGVTPETPNVGLVAIVKGNYPGEELTRSLAKVTGGVPDDTVLELSKRKLGIIKKVYGITGRELEAARLPNQSDEEVVKRLVVERSALVTIAG